MDKGTNTFGVSPAFVASLYGPDFSVPSFCAALPHVRALGFSAFQPEIARKETLPDWMDGGAREVAQAAREAGLTPTQFVAHYMEEFFSTPEMIASRAGLEELRQAVECAKVFEGCATLTVPMLPIKVDWGRYSGMDEAWFGDLMKRRTEKIHNCLKVVAGAGMFLALEILPFSIIGGVRRFIELCDEVGSDHLGINFDTGNARASGEILPLLPFELRGRIYGTHLGDNNGNENGKLSPGKGSIEWKPLLKNLRAAGYTGSLDIEIGCPPERVFDEYRNGLKYLLSQGAAMP
ncbi:MAG: sugar phosphate isomerase/epimerase family protein [Candidatus Aminicenantales bacterium]|jgi:sugar phosphate isomerase/epimerase